MTKPRTTILVGALALLLASCQGPEEVVQQTHADGTPKVVFFYEGAEQERKKVKEDHFYENGNMEMTGTFDEDGTRHGQWTYYHQDGALWSQGNFEHGERSGNYTVWYANGQKRYEGTYENDKPKGKWSFWKENGELEREMDYDQKQ